MPSRGSSGCCPTVDLPLPPLPLWIAAPEALRTTPRIRRVWDMLVAEFSR